MVSVDTGMSNHYEVREAPKFGGRLFDVIDRPDGPLERAGKVIGSFSEESLYALRDGIDAFLRNREEAKASLARLPLPGERDRKLAHLELIRQGGRRRLEDHMLAGHGVADAATRTSDELLRKHAELEGVSPDA